MMPFWILLGIVRIGGKKVLAQYVLDFECLDTAAAVGDHQERNNKENSNFDQVQLHQKRPLQSISSRIQDLAESSES
jgi:hypothetical protein